MQRYHKDVYFPIDSKDILKEFTYNLNMLKFNPSKHCLNNLLYRIINLTELLEYINSLVLNANDIFEYYIDGKYIEKACFRIPYVGNDIILVLSETKSIITIYLNESTDNHITLNEGIYSKN